DAFVKNNYAIADSRDAFVKNNYAIADSRDAFVKNNCAIADTRDAFVKNNYAIADTRDAFVKNNYAIADSRDAFVKNNYAIADSRDAFVKNNYAIPNLGDDIVKNNCAIPNVFYKLKQTITLKNRKKPFCYTIYIYRDLFFEAYGRFSSDVRPASHRLSAANHQGLRNGRISWACQGYDRWQVARNNFHVFTRCGEKAKPFRRSHFTCQKLERATCRQNIAPIVAAARCFVSAMGMQRL
ncbi:MAG: hypothetical protein WCL14_05360, partial [Bacteroidota bacterium]